MTKTREDNELIDRTSVVCVENDIELSWSIKTRHNNDMTDCIGAVYTENEIDLLWMIGLGAIWD